MGDLQGKLKGSGQRMTTQRQAVYSALRATVKHPTAEELFFTLRAQAPNISLATVYNTLEMLVSCGLALKLHGDGSAHYDGNASPHGHARCLSCGAVSDLPDEELPVELAALAIPAGFSPRAIFIEVVGLCACCQP